MSDQQESRPLCFVLMPFGRKQDQGGQPLDFDAIYRDVIRPAVEAARLDPIRADEEQAGGLIHKPMFERLILCDYAVADLTTANANVYYELGIRHAVRPRSTVMVFVDGTRLPFDLGPMRGIPYRVGPSGAAVEPEGSRKALTAALLEARKSGTDSPVFQLVGDMKPPDISRLRTDVFRDRVTYSARLKARLAQARRDGLEAVRAVRSELGNLHDEEAGVVVDLLLSFRAVKGWQEMITLVDDVPGPLARTVLVREQYAFALNRAGRGEEAEQVLTDVLRSHGPSSETYGLLGRVYKDRWESACQAGHTLLARGLLDKAIGAYLSGFQADWRDHYPGVNAVTLMEIREAPDARRAELLPVVTYAVKQRVSAGAADYWDRATLLELAVLRGDPQGAEDALSGALAALREGWERETTLRNLRLIREARERRGAAQPWLREIEATLGAGPVMS